MAWCLGGVALAGNSACGPAAPALATQVEAITGGVEVPSSAFPTVVMVRRLDDAQMCTGTLIASDVVLTAGHCFDDYHTNNVQVRVGLTDAGAGGGTSYEIDHWTRHPDYAPTSWSVDHDLALVFLATPVPELTPTPLSRQASDVAEGALGTLVGYGRPSIDGSSGVLRAAYDRPLATCDRIEAIIFEVTGGAVASYDEARFVCMERLDGIGKCRGDSGGPTFVEVDGVTVLAGVASQSDATCEYYSIDTQVSAELDFLDGELAQWQCDDDQACNFNCEAFGLPADPNCVGAPCEGVDCPSDPGLDPSDEQTEGCAVGAPGGVGRAGLLAAVCALMLLRRRRRGGSGGSGSGDGTRRAVPLNMATGACVLLIVSTACAKRGEMAMTRPGDAEAATKLSGSASGEASVWNYPGTKVTTAGDTIHGVFVADPYRWLEDGSAPEVKAWAAAQDALARGVLMGLPGREAFAKRLTELLYHDSISAPVHRKGRYFYRRKQASLEKERVFWKQGVHGEEQLLLDPNGWSADGSVGLKGLVPSPDGTLAAYQVSENNSDESSTHVLEVATGRKLPDVIPGTKYADLSWRPDGKGFYYTWVPPVSPEVTVAARPGFAELRYHALGASAARDEVVYGATGDPEAFIGGGISRDGKWLLVTVQHGWNSSDVYFREARQPGAAWQVLSAGQAANYAVEVWRDAFYVHTNEGAPRYRMFRVDPRHPARAQWQEIVPESEATLEGFSLVGEHLALTYLRHAANEIELRTLRGALVRKVALPGIGSTAGLLGNPDEDEAYFDYTSFTEPNVIYKASVKTGDVAEWARITLPIDMTEVVAEQVTYPSKDGTPVSMFLLHRRDAKRDGSTPTILYGYGGFNVSLTPEYSGKRAAWLERGGMYAIPNLRGGGEYGEAWHQAGMRLQKQNVFDDYVWAAKYLIDQGWTSPAHLGIEGGSNGGLLVGAAMVQAPELFGAVVCSVPLLDMARYHLFGSGKTWVPEYGSVDDPAQAAAILAYSPYQNIKPGTKYPALLMDAADSDDRVDPMHARKFIAAMQAASASNQPAILRIEAHAGHGGADLVKSQVERGADVLAFFWSQLAGK